MRGEEPALIVTLYGDYRNLQVDGYAQGLGDALRESGLRVALCPPEERFGGARGPDHLIQRFRHLCDKNDAVLIALSGPFDEDVLVAFDRSDRVVLLTDGSVPSVRSVRRVLQLTTALGFGVDRLRVMLVEPSPAAMDADAVGAALQRDIFEVLPAGGSPGQRLAVWTALVRRFVDSGTARVPPGSRSAIART